MVFQCLGRGTVWDGRDGSLPSTLLTGVQSRSLLRGASGVSHEGPLGGPGGRGVIFGKDGS